MTQVKTPPRPRQKPLKPRDSIYPDSVRKLFPPHFTDGDIAASLEGRPKITKIKKKRKGGNVKGYLAGGLLPPLAQGAGSGGTGTAPQAKVNPNTDKDRRLKDNALKKKQMDVAVAQAKAPPVPGKPGMAQKPPRALARKGGKIKMRKGDAVKSYSNICRSPVPRA